MPKDIRTLCGQHAQEMRDAGYRIIRTGNQEKSECDKCKRIGWEYFLNKRNV